MVEKENRLWTLEVMTAVDRTLRIHDADDRYHCYGILSPLFYKEEILMIIYINKELVNTSRTSSRHDSK